MMKTQRRRTELYRKLIVPVVSCGRMGSPCSLGIFGLVLYVLVSGQTALAGGGNGVDDLRGQWQFQLLGEGLAENSTGFNIFVNELGRDPSGGNDNDLVATGCVLTSSTGVLTPMSMKVADLGGGNYDLNILATAFPADGDPFAIQFLGSAHANSRGLNDDAAGGSFRTDSGEGDWSATHHDRRRTQCPPVNEIPPPGLEFSADVWVARTVEGGVVTREDTGFFGFTNVVSAGMLVTRPDGTTMTVPPIPYNFNVPQVDFISFFGYVALDPVPAPSGGVYTMTLLDALGNPIAGATTTDVWTDCQFSPARNVSAELTEGLDIILSWTPGDDPADEIDRFSIGTGPYPYIPDSAATYEANFIQQTEHVIPWLDFEVPSAPGVPDGIDFGVGLSSFPNGDYSIGLTTVSLAAPGSAGTGLECSINDTTQDLFFSKGDNSITFFTP